MSNLCDTCEKNQLCLFDNLEPCKSVIGWEKLTSKDINLDYKAKGVTLGVNKRTSFLLALAKRAMIDNGEIK